MASARDSTAQSAYIELTTTRLSSAEQRPPLKIPPIGQIPPPFERVDSKWHIWPWFVKQGRQIIRFDIAGLLNFRALITISKTFLLERKTLINMGIVTTLAVLAGLVVAFSGHDRSIQESASEDGSVGNIQALMSFVLAGYITIVVNRWDAFRNQTLIGLTGPMENICFLGMYLTDKHKGDPKIERHRENLVRYMRLVQRLMFSAARGVGGECNLDSLKMQGLLTNEEEYRYLAHATLATRPNMALMWLWRVFDHLRADGVHITEESNLNIQTWIANARGCIQSTLAMIDCPFPYSYAHIIHWVVQIYIWILAVDTGVGFVVQLNRVGNGEGDYTANSLDGYRFPTCGYVWLENNYLQQLAGNIAYILFSQGLLKTMLKLYNPFNDETTSFPEFVYDANIHNNFRAMKMGISEFNVVCAYNDREPNVCCSGFDGTEDTFEPKSSMKPTENTRKL